MPGDERDRAATNGKGIKKVRMRRSGMRTFRIQSPVTRNPRSQSPGSCLWLGSSAGLLARESSSGRLPGQQTSDTLPFVIAYSGGSAGESHPSSLLSPKRAPLIRYSILAATIYILRNLYNTTQYRVSINFTGGRKTKPISGSYVLGFITLKIP